MRLGACVVRALRARRHVQAGTPTLTDGDGSARRDTVHAVDRRASKGRHSGAAVNAGFRTHSAQ